MDSLRVMWIAGLTLCLLSGHARGQDAQFVVAGYLPEYRLAGWSRDAGPLTDVIFFGMSAPADGRFDAAAVSEQQLSVLRAFQEKSKCRLLFTVGGWNKSAGFPALAADAPTRAQFIADAREFCVRNGFAGIDYDWEHPEGAEQTRAFTELLKDTRASFAERGLIVTMAVAGWQALGAEAFQAVDRVHLMAYDHRYPHATMEKARADVDRLLQAGCPPGKIVLGVPFYGRNQAGDAKTYAELVRGAEQPAAESLIDGYACNGPALIAEKVRYAREQKLGGLMIWEIGQDIAGPKSLLRAISDSLKP